MGGSTQGYLVNIDLTDGSVISERGYGGGSLVSKSISPVPPSPVHVVERRVYGSLKYEADKGEDWKLPERALADAAGDCEDFGQLAAHLRGAPARTYLITTRTHLFAATTTPSGLVTMGDTKGPSVPIFVRYREADLRRWARMDRPTHWRRWK